jgi:hypothetical protein
MQQGFDKVKKVVEKEYRQSQAEVLQSAKDLKAQPVAGLEKDWRRQQERLKRLVMEGKGRVAD